MYRPICGILCGLFGLRRFLNYHMRICAAEPERANPGQTSTGNLVPRHHLLRNCDGHIGPIDGGIAGLEMKIGRNLMTLKAKYHLDEPCHAGCGFEMADI